VQALLGHKNITTTARYLSTVQLKGEYTPPGISIPVGRSPDTLRIRGPNRPSKAGKTADFNARSPAEKSELLGPQLTAIIRRMDEQKKAQSSRPGQKADSRLKVIMRSGPPKIAALVRR
jgi:hypothetical protein